MPDDKPASDRALELFVYAPVGVALYVRDMLPTMMTVFVSRGKREVQSHLPGQPPPVPTPPVPSSADVRRRVEESLGLARVVTESGIGVAKGVAGTGLGFARGLADTAVSGFGAMQPGRGSGGSSGNASAGAVVDDVAPATSAPPAASPDPAPPAPPTPPAPSAPAPSAPAPAASSAAPADEAPPASSTPASEPDDAGSTDGGPPAVESLAIPDYDELSASQVVERLEGLDDTSLEAIRLYESAHRGRNTILGKIARLT